jgi:methionine-S-sulfoxide reductase
MEELLRAIPGVVDTDVGYTGGWVANPRYEDTHHSKSGHAEAVRVVFDPAVLAYETLLRDWFFRMHDPTTTDRQGNDIGTQYRSAIFYTTAEQKEMAEATRDAYQRVISERGYGTITTEIASAAGHIYYLAEDYHQQYLFKVPHGYRCHANTGLALPALV